MATGPMGPIGLLGGAGEGGCCHGNSHAYRAYGGAKWGVSPWQQGPGSGLGIEAYWAYKAYGGLWGAGTKWGSLPWKRGLWGGKLGGRLHGNGAQGLAWGVGALGGPTGSGFGVK